MDLKKELAYDIVKQYHGFEAAEDAAKNFYSQVQSRDENLIEFKQISLQQLGLDFSQLTLLSLCSVLSPGKSKNELRRLIVGGGITLNSQKVCDPNILLKEVSYSDFKIKIGKRNFYEVKINEKL